MSASNRQHGMIIGKEGAINLQIIRFHSAAGKQRDNKPFPTGTIIDIIL